MSDRIKQLEAKVEIDKITMANFLKRIEQLEAVVDAAKKVRGDRCSAFDCIRLDNALAALGGEDE